MKKLILVLLVIGGLCSLTADGFYSRGEFSYFINNTEFRVPMTDRYKLTPDSLMFFTSVTIGADWKIFFAEAQTDFFLIHDTESLFFSPTSVNFYARGGIKYKAISIEYEHLCIHSIDGRGISGNHDKVSIKFNSKY
ncbi:MAG: hypothetical protein GY793_09080 [Proteobacteria bacterium]|nr:hypothetical protein [Pseudomonadota bacterium]